MPNKEKFRSGFTPIAILIVLVLFIITLAGGVVVWQRKIIPTPTPITNPVVSVSEPVVPGLSENVGDLPTAAPTFITPFPESSNKVQVILSKNTYHKGETITVSVKNNSNYRLGYYDCPGPKGGIVWFERKVNQTWEEEISLAGADYGSKRPCYPRFLEVKQELKVSRLVSAEVPSGIYRAVFGYIDGIVYSNEFQVL